MEVHNITNADVKGKRVLLRADFNVPIREGKVVDDMRIRATLPTIKLLLEHGAAKVTIIAHLGRPGGKVVEDLRMAPVALKLKEYIDDPRIDLHENIRFNPGEESNDAGLA